ncbi:GCK domain [Arabidopsis suecica]|uniref:GCK domain n=1 Tax=Arabidopsis suecica TaxID=45249 RepID=A0A8T2CT27_ARASU|nr:GCK domain [Arabidopsis suecica]
MGIMSSTDLKQESKSENNQVPSKEVRDRLQVFMKKGGCENSYTACVGCDSREDECTEAYSMLEKCMKARFDYFEPYLALKNASAEVMAREIEVFLHAKPKDRGELLGKFMTRGDCKEAFMAWMDSYEEAKKNKGSLYTPASNTLSKCIEAHSDYYQPLLTVVKNYKEHYSKERIAFLDAWEQAQAEAEG